MSTIENIIGFKEVRTRKFLKEVMVEFLATAILILAGCGAAITLEQGKPVPTYYGAWSFAVTVATIVWTFGHVSGAHINPTVTICFLVTGHVSIIKTIVFTIAQCGGAIAGSAALWYMVPVDWRGTLASTVFADGLTLAQGFGVEVACTFILLVGVFASSDRLRTDHAGSVPLTIGLIVYMQSAWAGPLTGASMNPARTLGPALISGAWSYHWVYWVAPILGGVLGALFYQHVLAETPPEVAEHLQSNQVLAYNITEKDEKFAKETLKVADSNSVNKNSLEEKKEGFDNPACEVES